MNTKLLFFVMSAASCGVYAQDIGRVISSTPVTQHVMVPRQVCTTAQPAPAQSEAAVPASDSASAPAPAPAPVSAASQAPASGAQQCVIRAIDELQTVAYDVVYELGGKQYSVQLPYAPGPTINFQSPAPAAGSSVAPASASAPMPVTPSTVYVVPADPVVVVAPPVYYYSPYYAPYAPVGVGIGLDFRFGGGWGGRWR